MDWSRYNINQNHVHSFLNQDIGYVIYYDNILHQGILRNNLNYMYFKTYSNDYKFKSGDFVGFIQKKYTDNNEVFSENEVGYVKPVLEYKWQGKSGKHIAPISLLDDSIFTQGLLFYLTSERSILDEADLSKIVCLYLSNQNKKADEYLMSKITYYVDSINIKELIDSYKVSVVVGGHSRINKDEDAWIYITGKQSYLFKRGDTYLDNLLPDKVFKDIFFDSNFCLWFKMLDFYYKDEKLQKDLAKEADLIDLEVKQNAKNLYNKEHHISSLFYSFQKNIYEKIENEKRELCTSLEWWEHSRYSNILENINKCADFEYDFLNKLKQLKDTEEICINGTLDILKTRRTLWEEIISNIPLSKWEYPPYIQVD